MAPEVLALGLLCLEEVVLGLRTEPDHLALMIRGTRKMQLIAMKASCAAVLDSEEAYSAGSAVAGGQTETSRGLTDAASFQKAHMMSAMMTDGAGFADYETAVAEVAVDRVEVERTSVRVAK